MHEEFQKHIISVNKNQIEEYDSIKPFTDEDYLTGSRYKFFVRCSSKLFKDLIKELRDNPNCSYETYMNDLIKSGYTPKFISMLKKEENTIMMGYDKDGIEHFRDVCASRILNFFECPTTYEKLLNIDGENYCCSVDFSRRGEDFYSFARLVGLGEDNLVENIAYLKVMLDNLTWENKIRNFCEMRDKLFEDYAYSFLIRRYVLADSDSWFNNFGIIINTKNKTFRMAPNYDFEYCFDNVDTTNKDYLHKMLNKDLNLLQQSYPNVYKKFITKFNEFLACKRQCPTYVRLIEGEIGDEEKARIFFGKFGGYLQELDKIIKAKMIM